MTARNVEPLFNALRNAKAPPKFTQRFLEELDFKSTNDRLYINVFKAIGLLSEDGSPTARYFEFMDQTQSRRVLAEALEEAYADLFQVRRDAQNMERQELRGKIKTLTQGQVSDNVVDKMAMTFLALAEQADFDAPRPNQTEATEEAEISAPDDQRDVPPIDLGGSSAGAIKLGGFVYNVELHLPDSRDPAVYEALFRALKTHLLS
ncbi:MAG TPA: DUF5343 domain-containing protein [Thermoleophilaceae bacterium]|nr:DUF5343 domain-containing protein [Thermoleophilaceae bacterium]